LDQARGCLVLIHGRGSTAASIIELGNAVCPPGIAMVAPQAEGHTWYPHSFLRPTEMNEPKLSSAIASVDRIVSQVIEGGIAAERLAILGFSQGACLTLEYAIRNPRRYGGLFALSGGLIGPPGTQWPTDAQLEGTPVFIGCSDIDDHVPLARVNESADVFRRAGAAVDERIYPGMAHTVNADEAGAVRQILRAMIV